MMKYIDTFLNSITMYRLLMYGLLLLALLSLILGFSGGLNLSGGGMLASLLILIFAGYGINGLLARIWQVPFNVESSTITALILFFVLPPVGSVSDALLILLAAVIAMASKFFVTRNRAHLFNPAALAVVVLGLTGLMQASWWVGNSLLWPFTLLVGLLVVRKIRQGYMLAVFSLVAVAVYMISGLQDGNTAADILTFAVTASPLIFLGTIMLTEPATMPWRRMQRLTFAALVALLLASHPTILGQFVYPETALVMGNLFALAVSPRLRVRMRLKAIHKVSNNIASYVFTPDKQIVYRPGQYMEWTIPASKSTDGRGNRRTFTIASSPTEKDIMIGLKFYEPSSSFKTALQQMKPGAIIHAGQMAGDFTMPGDEQQKLCFIAGGIGITPFRSMVKYLVDTKQHRDVVLLYFVSSPGEVVYMSVFDEAISAGVRTTIVLSSDRETKAPADWNGETGIVDKAMIKHHVADIDERLFYVSGSNAMVEHTTAVLQDLDVARTRIRTDHFSGY